VLNPLGCSERYRPSGLRQDDAIVICWRTDKSERSLDELIRRPWFMFGAKRAYTNGKTQVVDILMHSSHVTLCCKCGDSASVKSIGQRISPSCISTPCPHHIMEEDVENLTRQIDDERWVPGSQPLLRILTEACFLVIVHPRAKVFKVAGCSMTWDSNWSRPRNRTGAWNVLSAGNRLATSI
jgi:hypothetical protein